MAISETLVVYSCLVIISGDISVRFSLSEDPDSRRLISDVNVQASTFNMVLSKFNRCHLPHIKADAGQPSIPVQEFNPIACSPSLSGPEFEPRLASVHCS